MVYQLSHAAAGDGAVSVRVLVLQWLPIQWCWRGLPHKQPRTGCYWQGEGCGGPHYTKQAAVISSLTQQARTNLYYRRLQTRVRSPCARRSPVGIFQQCPHKPTRLQLTKKHVRGFPGALQLRSPVSNLPADSHASSSLPSLPALGPNLPQEDKRKRSKYSRITSRQNAPTPILTANQSPLRSRQLTKIHATSHHRCHSYLMLPSLQGETS